MNSIDIKNLKFSYIADEIILDSIDFEVAEGEFAVIIGGNGSGKSTLIKNILGELKPDKGEIKILGKKMNQNSDYKDLGYVPQISVVEKIAFPITVIELVVLNLYKDFGFFKYPKKEHIRKADEILEYMDLYSYRNVPINKLSGGLKQRSMIARAMVHDPKILILDEPTVGVDKESKKQFLEMISKLNKEKKLTILLITHELEEVMRLGQAQSLYEIKDKKLYRRELS